MIVGQVRCSYISNYIYLSIYIYTQMYVKEVYRYHFLILDKFYNFSILIQTR